MAQSIHDQKNRGMAVLSGQSRGDLWYVSRVCLVATLGGLLFGYDTAVISGAIGFLEKRFALSPAQVGWAASSALIGCVIGAMFAGIMSDRFGRKKVLLLSAILFLISSIGTALPRNLTELVLFRIMAGLGVGIASMTSPMYIAEISPAAIRGRLVSLNQFAIISGMLVIYFVNMLIARAGDEVWNINTGWRWMFGSGIVPSGIFFMLLLLVPESPRWLTKQGRRDQAIRILSRVGGADHADSEMLQIEEAISHESGSLKQLFEPGMKIILVIGVVLAVLQQITGINVFLYYAPEIFKKLGSGTDAALLQTVVIGIFNLGFTIIAVWTVDKWGRKPLLMIGAAGMAACLFAIGMAAYLQKTEMWILIFILGYISCFALAIGPVTWVVLSEIFPTRIRGRAMSIATVCLWCACYLVSQTFPMMANNAWLLERFHNAFPFWFYGAMCVVEFVFVWRLIPETKGKSLEEIEKMWIKEKV